MCHSSFTAKIRIPWHCRSATHFEGWHINDSSFPNPPAWTRYFFIQIEQFCDSTLEDSTSRVANSQFCDSNKWRQHFFSSSSALVLSWESYQTVSNSAGGVGSSIQIQQLVSHTLYVSSSTIADSGSCWPPSLRSAKYSIDLHALGVCKIQVWRQS